MKKFAQLSLVDVLLNRMPELHPSMAHQMSPQLEDKLFNIWKDKKNKLSDNLYKKPVDLQSSDLAEMEKAGLVTAQGNKLHITQKGSSAIKQMILGDERSSFEDDGSNVSYKQAVSNTKTPSKLKEKNKAIENDWWSRF